MHSSHEILLWSAWTFLQSTLFNRPKFYKGSRYHDTTYIVLSFYSRTTTKVYVFVRIRLHESLSMFYNNNASNVLLMFFGKSSKCCLFWCKIKTKVARWPHVFFHSKFLTYHFCFILKKQGKSFGGNIFKFSLFSTKMAIFCHF